MTQYADKYHTNTLIEQSDSMHLCLLTFWIEILVPSNSKVFSLEVQHLVP